MQRICQTCGKSFNVNPARLRQSPRAGSWCSMACRTGAGGWMPNNPRQFAELDERIIAEYQSGANGPQLATKYGISLGTVMKALHLNGIQVKRYNDNLLKPEVREKAKRANVERLKNNNPNARRDLPSDKICQAYQCGESLERIAAHYKCSVDAVLARVRAAGIEVRRRGYTTANRVTCSDGHIADSGWESQIDEWLTTHNIVHEIHPRTPWYAPTARSFGDFRVGDIFIEVWGITGSLRYEEKRAKKIALYRQYGTTLIQIFPHHILDRDFTPLEILL